MSLFLLNNDGDNEVEVQSSEQSDRNSPSSNIAGLDSSNLLKNFWHIRTEEIKKIQNLDPRCQNLPLARIKKIMKLDEEVRMISAEAPVLFAKAAELFILELTLRAWLHTEGNKRRTLQRNDIAMAISKYDQFDFLIDIVPRDEIKPQGSNKSDSKSALNSDQVHYYFHLAQHQAAMQNTASTSQPASIPIQLIQPTQIQAITVNPHQELKSQNNSAAPQIVQLQGSGAGAIQLVQQVVTPTGEVQHVPVQLNSNQMQMIRMQVQGGNAGAQPLILQAAPSTPSTESPHVIQVSQASNSGPVFIQSNGAENE